MFARVPTKPRRARSRCRRGTALVEFAVCLPIIVLLGFASIEACTMIYLKQSLTISAYEGGRTAITPGATSADVIADCTQVLSDRGVQGATIVLNPSDITTAAESTYLEINVTAPCDQNLIAGAWFFEGKTLNGRSIYMKEY
jgi:Flp pilus assembly protein TadG